MKTQLLEDIGENAAASLTPTKIVVNPKADTEVHKPAPAGKAQPARPRSTSGVWRQAPVEEPLISPARQADEAPTPLELDKVLEEIAALEAQYVPPAQQHEIAIAPPAPRHALPAPPAEPPPEPATPAAEATLAPNPAQSVTAPQDPLFDFTAPSPEQQAANPFTPAPTRPRGRYLLWAACLLSGALLIQGGRWFYEERNAAASRTLTAATAKETPRVDQAVERPAIAREAMPGAAAEARGTPAVPANPPSPAVPPLVMLEPDPPAAAKPEQPPPSVAGQAKRRVTPKHEPAAERQPASALPKPSRRPARAQSDVAAEKARKRSEREPVRQLARASLTEKERPSAPDTSMTATLKACREHGYHAAQCIKRECSVTEYGFVCRGR